MATKVVDKLTVAASPPADGGVLPLTFFDVPWIFTGPVERVFLYTYPHAVEHLAAHLLPSLASSLSAALHRFYPLLGRVRPCSSGGGGGGYEFCSTGGDADRVELTVAESGDDFEELAGGGPMDVRRLYSLVPRLPRPEEGSSELAAVQVTVFPGKGLAVGVSIHHVACDDSSFMHFVKTWAANCRVASGGDVDAVLPPPPPFLDRGVVADPDGLAAKTLDQMRQLANSGPPPPPPSGPPPKLFMASFTLTRDSIDKLKQRVTASGGGGVHCSAFTVACAYAWTCLARVDATSAARERAHLLFSVAIGAAIRGLDDGVLDGADGWFQKIVSLMPHRPMSIGGSPRYGVYDTDFGLGRPAKVELLSIDKTPGTVSMAEARDGHGGIEIGVALPEADMARFSSCFADGLKQL